MYSALVVCESELGGGGGGGGGREGEKEREREREREEAEREKITNTTAICTVAHLLDKIVLTDSAYKQAY